MFACMFIDQQIDQIHVYMSVYAKYCNNALMSSFVVHKLKCFIFHNHNLLISLNL